MSCDDLIRRLEATVKGLESKEAVVGKYLNEYQRKIAAYQALAQAVDKFLLAWPKDGQGATIPVYIMDDLKVALKEVKAIDGSSPAPVG